MLSPELITEIQKLRTFEECDEVFALVKSHLAKLETLQSIRFHTGQDVWFESKKSGGKRLEGKVIKINPKSILVEVTSEGFPRRWKVSPSLLNPVEPKKESKKGKA
jgi:hypothetical protein